ncbi:alpha-tocopherol transfer protein [Agrilus planipennis]|uniref:Alpha-tocopherol transfer protein n=1 Tax=Agrilus planipennis TaxID=224129 RepID=A0A1W4WDM0_AGRPL|nr:alpha-tocopherol transfer protein [Agrilus planipennis]
MYNDCILSEDGLAEGYVVIFDMHGIRLGHIARVSLPALRAFMLYIQEAHPAKLKAVHCLNTANYINHVMRLISPLLRNEIIGLLRFHSGRLPEGIPQEILPREYGGNAPSIDVLDKQCHSLINKYADWLIETEQFKADETKRPKKASWWSIFSGGGGNPNNLGLIENQSPLSVEFD